MSSPKRRRLSTASPPAVPAARRLSSSHAQPSRSLDKGKGVARNPLEGFDDREPSPSEAEKEQEKRLQEEADTRVGDALAGLAGDEDEEEAEHCAVCLSPVVNKTVVFPCHHSQYCFGCIRSWTDHSRRCPLCLGNIQHLMHSIRSQNDYSIHYLLPLASTSTSSAADLSAFPQPPPSRRPPAPLPRHALYGASRAGRYGNSATAVDDTTWREREEERALERRKYVYREGLYAKHVASNRYTGFKPFGPQAFAANNELKSRVIKFIRRELQVFPSVDITFLTTYLISIASQLDLRSSAAIRLISDFLTPDDAEHLAHEIVTFARSPFISLEGYDRVIQYGRPSRGGADGTLDEKVGVEVGPASVAPRAVSGRRPSVNRRDDEPRFAPAMRGQPLESAHGRCPLPPQDSLRRPPPFIQSRGGLPPRPSGPPFDTRRDHDRWATQPNRRDDDYRGRGGYGPRGGRGAYDDRDRYYGGRRAYSRERNRSRSRSRSRSVSRDRKDYDRRRRSPSRSRSRSRSRHARSPSPRHRDSRRSRSRSYSRSPPRRSYSRSLSPRLQSHSRSHSRSLTPSSATLPAGRSSAEQEREAAHEPVSLSIFGLARKRQPTTGQDAQVEDTVQSLDEEPVAEAPADNFDSLSDVFASPLPTPLPKSPSKTTFQPSSQLSRPGSAASTSAGPPTDLRSKLAARLMAEYRTALANRSSSTSIGSPSITATALPAGAQTLSLRERLQREKDLSVSSSSTAFSGHAGLASVATVFSEETRQLLLARLEEEKAFVVQNGADAYFDDGMDWDDGDTWENDVSRGNDGPQDDQGWHQSDDSGWAESTPASPPFIPQVIAPPLEDDDNKETALRRLLLSKRAAASAPALSTASAAATTISAEEQQLQQQQDLAARGGNLKERLMKAKLMKLKAQKVSA